eukprot:CAMPEP_0117655988 /NCGR_PEP_ID=MMETSP0804-20121206/4566_1 /TAXON_ID=1074897 /ORGANISM="Tetraselmis astigmatica, Strain CCMP880" /LENGTH=103 /DNA_ID=CAMNT_0005462363 /DNA_START=82 /DNA_END=393 /DNA_ORIENTATION=+
MPSGTTTALTTAQQIPMTTYCSTAAATAATGKLPPRVQWSHDVTSFAMFSSCGTHFRMVRTSSTNHSRRYVPASNIGCMFCPGSCTVLLSECLYWALILSFSF